MLQRIYGTVIMNFRQEGMKTEQVLKGLEALLVQGNFPARTIIIDGFNFYLPAAADVRSSNSLPSTASSNSGQLLPPGR